MQYRMSRKMRLILAVILLYGGLFLPLQGKIWQNGQEWTAFADSLSGAGDPIGEAWARMSAGRAFLSEGKNAEALAAFQMCVPTYEALEDHRQLAACYLGFAEGHLALGEMDEAGQFLGVASHNLDMSPDPLLRAKALYLQELSDLEPAIAVNLLAGKLQEHPSIGAAPALPPLNLSEMNAEGLISPWWLLAAIPLIILPFFLWYFATQGAKAERTNHAQTEKLRQEIAAKASQMERENAGLRSQIRKLEDAEAQILEKADGLETDLSQQIAEKQLAQQSLSDLRIAHSQEIGTLRKSHQMQLDEIQSGEKKRLLDAILQSMLGVGLAWEPIKTGWEELRSSLGEKVQSTEKVQHFNQLIQSSDPIEWTSFERQFELRFPGFSIRLLAKYPSLTAHDIRICCLLRLDLHSKEMAHLLQITSHAVDVARYRLRKKLDLERNQSFLEILEKI